MTKAEQTAETDPVAHVVHETCVWLNKAGTRFAAWEAVAPEGASFDDLLDPAAWKRVQQSKRPAIRQGDEIRIQGFDRSWVAWCFVAHASAAGIVLSRFADTKPQGPVEHLAEDDKYRVLFTGAGYEVRRKSDDQKVSNVFVDASRAATALRELYPKVVS